MWATNEPTIAMLKQLAPSCNSAVAKKQSLNQQRDGQREHRSPGPEHDGCPTPTACPVVPPGRGTLNIMMTKQNALVTASSGTSRVSDPFYPREGRIQKGTAAAYSVAQVEGLR